MIDGIDGLLPFATERQRELLTSWNELGSSRKAAAEHGVTRQALQDALKRVRQLAKEHGLPDVDPARTGYSTLYRGGKDVDGEGREVVMQWVKHATPKPQKQSEAEKAQFWRDLADELSASIKPLPPVKLVSPTASELCAVYPVGDQHNGMLAWKHESGESWDLDISERTLKNAIDYLVASMPPAQYAVLPVLGDFGHYDSHRPETPAHRNLLDADGRFGKMYRSHIRLALYMRQRILEKHEFLHMIWLKGNHDPTTAQTIIDWLQVMNENEPRVTVDNTPSFFSYHRFGQCLFGFTHGDKTRAAQLPGVMAYDRAKDWGETTHRTFFTGHWHSKRVEDFPGCTVEVMRVLPPGDAWATGAGYRSIRGMEAIMYHERFGEVIRLPVKPMMFDTPEPEEDK